MTGKPLPHAALLVLASALAGVVIFYTWPTRTAVSCEQLPELTVLAVCAAILLVFSMRALAAASRRAQPALPRAYPPDPRADRQPDPRPNRHIAGGAAILAALAFFLSAHYIRIYRKPCVAVQQHFSPSAKTH